MKPSSFPSGGKKPPRRSAALRIHLQDLSRAPVKRYVDVQRERGLLVPIGDVDVDMEQIVSRHFLCDRHRCIHWTPHTKQADARPLIDNSCCSRYTVPVTDLDRKKLVEVLPLVKKRLAKDHPLRTDPDALPYELDDEFAFNLAERADGVCQFVLYEKGMTTCAIHKTCLEEGLDVWEYKPLGCSLWPLALVDYDDDGKERYLLTIYDAATSGIFESVEDSDPTESKFACLVDDDPSYEPVYQATAGVLKHTLGEDFYNQLHQRAQEYLRR